MNVNLDDVQKVIPIMGDAVSVHIIHVILTQYSLKAGMSKFRQDAENAVSKDLRQLHDMETFIPLDPGKLTKQQKKKRWHHLCF